MQLNRSWRFKFKPTNLWLNIVKNILYIQAKDVLQRRGQDEREAAGGGVQEDQEGLQQG